MKRLMTHLQGERGAVELLVAAGMVFFLVLAALVIDIGNADQTNRGLQNAADSGALAATQQLNNPNKVAYAGDYALDTLNQPRDASTGCPSAPASEAPTGSTCYAFSSNGAINGAVYVTTPWGPDIPFGGCSPGSCPTADQEVNVKVCQTVNTSFARVINIRSERLCKAATGVLGTTTEPLALFTNGSTCGGQGFAWSSSDSNVAGVVWSDSFFTMTGSNNTLGPTFYVCSSPVSTWVGGGGNTYNGQQTGVQAAFRPDPCGPGTLQCDTSIYPGNCTGGILTSLPSALVPNSVYCVNSNSHVTADVSGLDIKDTFIVTGGADLKFTCNNNTSCHVSPADAGGGFVAWNRSTASTCNSTLIVNNNPGALTLDGTIYAPTGKVQLNLATTGTSNAFIDACTMNVNGTVNGTGPGVPVSNSNSNLIR